jgi:hypothetical protein
MTRAERLRLNQLRRVETFAATGKIPPKARHGTRGVYVDYGCRCDECRVAHLDYCRKRGAERRAIVATCGLPQGVKHGYSAYQNWGCRCRICTDANTASSRAFAQRQKAEAAK